MTGWQRLSSGNCIWSPSLGYQISFCPVIEMLIIEYCAGDYSAIIISPLPTSVNSSIILARCNHCISVAAFSAAAQPYCLVVSKRSGLVWFIGWQQKTQTQIERFYRGGCPSPTLSHNQCNNTPKTRHSVVEKYIFKEICTLHNYTILILELVLLNAIISYIITSYCTEGR